MKHFLFIFALFLPLTLPGLCCVTDCPNDWKLEVRAAFYNPTSSKLTKIYSNNWFDYEVEMSTRVHDLFEVWGGVYWANKDGHGKLYPYEFRDTTKIHVLPIALGGKFIYPLFPCAEVYVGAGVCYSFLKIHNHCKEKYYYWGLSSSPFEKNIYKSDWGGIVKLGTQICLCEEMFLDFFVDYISQRFKLSHHHRGESHQELLRGYVNCSGFKFGAGVGVYF